MPAYIRQLATIELERIFVPDAIPVRLTVDEQALLQAQATAQGVSVDTFLRRAILEVISATPETKPPLSAEEFDKAFEEIADMIPEGIPPLSDAALSRDSI